MSAREAAAVVYGLLGSAAYSKRVTWRGRPVRFENRGPGAHMGRFGGGWDRELGLQIGRNGLKGTVIVNVWRGSVRIDPRRTA